MFKEKVEAYYKWFQMKEKHKRYGKKNPNTIFYIIRRDAELAGLNSFFITNLGHIRHAVGKGWIPIVDMQNYPNCYLEKDELGKVNAWDYYYKQPCGNLYSLEEAYQSKNVILSSGQPLAVYPDDSMDFFTRKESMIMWHELFIKYVGFSDVLLQEADKYYDKYLADKIERGERILCVSVRGAYAKLRPYRHPVQPSVEEALKKTKEVLEEQNCQWVYLATEDEEIVKIFGEEFGGKIITIERKLYPAPDDYRIVYHSFERERDAYLKGLEYQIQMILASRCNCFIGGRTSGNVAAMIFNPHYDYTYFWNLGRYGVDDAESVQEMFFV